MRVSSFLNIFKSNPNVSVKASESHIKPKDLPKAEARSFFETNGFTNIESCIINEDHFAVDNPRTRISKQFTDSNIGSGKRTPTFLPKFVVISGKA